MCSLVGFIARPDHEFAWMPIYCAISFTHHASMNFAIIGPGGIADDQHAPAIKMHPAATLWSVLSRSDERGLAFAHKHRLKAPNPVHTQLSTLLDDPALEAVVIATPDRLHAEQVIAAAEAGKHILLEKPMATSTAECDAMIEACESNEVVLAMAYHLRWHDGHRKIQQQVSSGELGTLRHIRVHWTFQAEDGSNWRSDPDTGRWWALAANGTHCLDLIRWMISPSEGEIVNVHALMSSAKFKSPHDESAIVAMDFESGATAEFCVSVQYASQSRIEIYGDSGSVHMEDTMGRHGAGEIFLNGSAFDFDIHNPFLRELDDLIEAIEQGRSPEVNAREGRRNVDLLTLALKVSNADRFEE